MRFHLEFSLFVIFHFVLYSCCRILREVCMFSLFVACTDSWYILFKLFSLFNATSFHIACIFLAFLRVVGIIIGSVGNLSSAALQYLWHTIRTAFRVGMKFSLSIETLFYISSPRMVTVVGKVSRVMNGLNFGDINLLYKLALRRFAPMVIVVQILMNTLYSAHCSSLLCEYSCCEYLATRSWHYRPTVGTLSHCR